jgi:hypothetical protein
MEQDGCRGLLAGPDSSQGLRAARGVSYYNDGLKADIASGRYCGRTRRVGNNNTGCREACLAAAKFAIQLNNFFLFPAPERPVGSRAAPVFPTEYQ